MTRMRVGARRSPPETRGCGRSGADRALATVLALLALLAGPAAAQMRLPDARPTPPSAAPPPSPQLRPSQTVAPTPPPNPPEPAAATAPTAPAPAPPAPPPGPGDDRRAATRAELQAVIRDLDLGKERQAEIRREIEALQRDRTRISTRLVAAAARMKEAETRVAATEARIAELDVEIARARASLDERRGVLAEILAALQRIGHKPPPAVVVRPEDALASVRSAILLGALLPELRGQAETLLADLRVIEEIKTAAAAERDRFQSEATDLVAERRRLELLIEERKASVGDQEKRLEGERAEAARLAEKATSLRDLIASLGAAPPPVAPPPTEGRLTPAIPFAEARGRLPLPASGEIVGRFGEDDGTGLQSRGISIATRRDTPVTSPCDGSVIFAGPFRSYGKLLIINGGGGYHVVLAGLDRVDVGPGQFVLAGEPVGTMGAKGMASMKPDDGGGRPVLYVEFRKDSASIDPTPWWARARDEKVRG